MRGVLPKTDSGGPTPAGQKGLSGASEASNSFLRSSAAVTLLSLVSSATGFANQLLLAKHFGASAHMDVYLLAMSIPFTMMGLNSGTFSSSLVPALVGQRNTSEGRQFAGFWLILVALCSLLVCATVQVSARSIIRILAPALSPSLTTEGVIILRLAGVSVCLQMVVSYLGAVQNAMRLFWVPVVASVIPVLGMIFGAAFFATYGGIVTVAYGFAFGYFVSLVLSGYQAWPQIDLTFGNRSVRATAFRALLPIPLTLLSLLCFSFYPMSDAYWASLLLPSQFSYLGYAQRLLIVVGSFVVLGPGTVLLPHLSECAAAKNWSFFDYCGALAVRVTLLWSGLAAVIISILAAPVIRLLLERGTFGSDATAGVAEILPEMLTGMVPMVGTVMAFRVLYAKRDFAGAAAIGVTWSVLYTATSGVLVRHLQLHGIAIAYLSVWWLVFAVTALRAFRSATIRRETPAFVLRSLVSLAGCGVGAFLAKSAMEPLSHRRLQLGCQCLLVAAVAVILFSFITAYWFRMKEVQFAGRAAAKIFGAWKRPLSTYSPVG